MRGSWWGSWGALALAVLTIAAGAARADVRDCQQSEIDAPHLLDADADDDHALFVAPQIVYNRPEAKELGLELDFIVDETGRPLCLFPYNGYMRTALDETPERRALVAAMNSWRFKPFLGKGKPVRARVSIYIHEKIEFRYHEDMPAAPPSTAVILLSRGECMGRCPAYTLTLHGDGSVEYVGSTYTAVWGKHVYSVPPGDVAALIERVKAKDVWSMAGNWVWSATDGAYYSMDITLGGQTRHFADYFGDHVGMPQALSEAMDDVDRTSRVEDWIHLSSFAISHLEAEGFAFRSQAGADLLLQAVNDDENRDDAAMLRLIELGAPVVGGRPGKDEFHDAHDGLLDAALFYHRAPLIDPLIAKGALMTGGRLDQAKIDLAFQNAVSGGRLALVQHIWAIAGSRPHPLLTYTDSDDDGKHKRRSPVVLLLRRQDGDDHWEGLAIAQWLAAHGNDLKAVGANGDNLLDIAVSADDIPMAKFLIAQGLDPSRPGQYSENALGGVEEDENMAMVLIDAGANPWAPETKTYSFVDFAKSKGWTRVLAWMEAHKSTGK